jgi:hypothetical protein
MVRRVAPEARLMLVSIGDFAPTPEDWTVAFDESAGLGLPTGGGGFCPRDLAASRDAKLDLGGVVVLVGLVAETGVVLIETGPGAATGVDVPGTGGLIVATGFAARVTGGIGTAAGLRSGDPGEFVAATGVATRPRGGLVAPTGVATRDTGGLGTTAGVVIGATGRLVATTGEGIRVTGGIAAATGLVIDATGGLVAALWASFPIPASMFTMACFAWSSSGWYSRAVL